MSHKYQRGEFELPSCTTIIDDCTNMSFGLKKWAAAEVVRWIKENTSYCATMNGDGFFYVEPEDLEKAEKAYETTGKTALDVGSEVHDAIEKYLTLKMQDKTPENWKFEFKSDQGVSAFDAFLKWQRDHALKPIALEQTVYGDFWGGKLDFLGYFDGKLFVIDWKSSKSFYPEMRY